MFAELKLSLYQIFAHNSWFSFLFFVSTLSLIKSQVVLFIIFVNNRDTREYHLLDTDKRRKVNEEHEK